MFRVVMFVNDAVEFIYQSDWKLTEGEATCVAEALAQYSKRTVVIQYRDGNSTSESDWHKW